MIAGIFIVSLAACASLPDNSGRLESHAYHDTQDTTIGRCFNSRAKSHTGESGFHLLGNGLDAFVARAALASVAERSIDTQYYMIHNDVVGSLFIDQLYKAAERGVRVRLLVDDKQQTFYVDPYTSFWKRFGVGFMRMLPIE